MSVYVSVRARLKDDPEKIKQLHDQVTGATQDQAKAAGDVGHKIYLNPADPKDFLGIDEWQSAEAFQKFASNPQIQEFFGQMFEGQPEVKVWAEADWKQW